jgi:hypothetical protein
MHSGVPCVRSTRSASTLQGIGSRRCMALDEGAGVMPPQSHATSLGEASRWWRGKTSSPSRCRSGTACFLVRYQADRCRAGGGEAQLGKAQPYRGAVAY